MKRILKKILVMASIISIVVSSPITSTAAEKEGENLVINGDCSQNLNGWSNTELWQISQNAFLPKAVPLATMYQDISIQNIPEGTKMKLSATMYCLDQTPIDVGTLKLEFLNADKTKILSSNSISHANDKWVVETITMLVPKEAMYARVTLHGERNIGNVLDAYFKDINLRAVTYEKENQLKVVMEIKEELQLSVDNNLDENLNMIWSSSDDSIAKVGQNGVVTALKKGNATITVTSKDGTYTDIIHILVVEDAIDLRLALDMKVGTKRRVTIDDLTDTKKVTWSSMDSSIATIDTKGKITAVNKGLVLITATDENGEIVGTIYVRVRN